MFLQYLFGNSLKKIYLLAFILLFGTIVISHDYFCHEHLHELCSPLHSLFDSPAPVEVAILIGGPPPSFTLSVRNDKIRLFDYIKNIFHPPDFLS
jgi:hypothetical protein